MVCCIKMFAKQTQWFATIHQVVHEKITKKPLCFISLQIIISIIALDQYWLLRLAQLSHTQKIIGI